jgi:hypothetical protein
MTIKFDTTKFDRKVAALLQVKHEVMKQALPIFVGYTPKKSGNARSKTRLSNDTIKAEYDYAGKLDEGASRQAPNGMVDPTEKELARLVRKEVIKRGK